MRRDRVLAVIAVVGIVVAAAVIVWCGARPAPPREAKRADECQLLVSPGVQCSREWVRRIGEAKESIFVRVYGFTDREIAASLIEARRRGVPVDIVADDSDRTARNSQTDECAGGGCTVLYDSEHPIAHAKVLVVDRRRVVLGSYNPTESAKKNAEVLISLERRDLAELLIADHELHAKHSRK